MPGTDNGNIAIFEIRWSNSTIYDRPLRRRLAFCPASVYLEFVNGWRYTHNQAPCQILRWSRVSSDQIHFTKALTSTVNKEDNTMIKVVIETENGTFSIGSGLSQSDSRIIHARGEYQFNQLQKWLVGSREVLPLFPRFSSKRKSIIQNHFLHAQSTRLYFLVSSNIRKSFKLSNLWISTQMEWCYGHCNTWLGYVIAQVSSLTLYSRHSPPRRRFHCQPAGDLHEAYICNEIGLLEFIPSFIKSGTTFVVHCNISWSSEQNAMLCESYCHLQTLILGL